jgi:hypothetical protein
VERLLIWRGLDSWRAEAAHVRLTSDAVEAHGAQLGVEPEPYQLEYDLVAADGFVTRSLDLRAWGDTWSRTLSLVHDGNGSWVCDQVEATAVEGALDCDLGFSPLTNLMPLRRHGLHRKAGSVEILAAWVSVPDLTLHASRQRYETVSIDVDLSVVRYSDRGTHQGFESDLVVDTDGLVVVYPQLAEQVQA